MKLNKLKDIELLKNIAIVLVLLGHAGCIYAGKWSYSLVHMNSNFIRYITEYIYSFHMPLYVFISGYIYNYMRIKLNKYDNLQSFIQNKFKRLIIPYLFTGILFMIPLQTLFNVYTDDISIANRMIVGILLSKQPAHLWYLVMLFNIFIIFRVFESRIRDNKYYINITLLIILNVISVLVPNVYQLSNVLRYLIYFYIGYIINENFESIKSIKLSIVFLIHMFLFNIYYFIIDNISMNIPMKLTLWILQIVISISGIAYLYISVNVLLKSKNIDSRITNSRIYNVINKYNFYIYLLHQPIMLSIISVLRNIDIKPIFMYTILFILTLGLTVLIAIVIDNYKKKYKSLLIGFSNKSEGVQ